MRKPDLARWAPPGLHLKPELRFFSIGLFCAVLYACSFFVRYIVARGELFRYDGQMYVLLPGAVMPDFHVLLGRYWLGLAVLSVCLLGLMLYHYAYHRQGSRSIYLMRRLPNGLELHRRCLTLPLVALALCAAIAALLLPLFYATYQLATPPECLTPHQWQTMWSVIL